MMLRGSSSSSTDRHVLPPGAQEANLFNRKLRKEIQPPERRSARPGPAALSYRPLSIAGLSCESPRPHAQPHRSYPKYRRQKGSRVFRLAASHEFRSQERPSSSDARMRPPPSGYSTMFRPKPARRTRGAMRTVGILTLRPSLAVGAPTARCTLVVQLCPSRSSQARRRPLAVLQQPFISIVAIPSGVYSRVSLSRGRRPRPSFRSRCRHGVACHGRLHISLCFGTTSHRRLDHHQQLVKFLP